MCATAVTFYFDLSIIEVLNFHSCKPFDLATGESCFLCSFVLYRYAVVSHEFDMCQTLHTGGVSCAPIVDGYEPVHATYTRTAGIQPGMFLEIHAKIQGELLVCRTKGHK